MTKRSLLAAAALAAVAGLTAGCSSGAVGGSGGPSSLPPGVSLPPGGSVPPGVAAPLDAPSTRAGAPTMPSPDATRISSRPGIFVGTWHGHSRLTTINATGTGTVTYRVYVTCAAGVPQPCDEFRGNEIIDGGGATFTVEKVLTAHHTSTAIVRVTASTDPKTAPVGSTQQLYLKGDVFDSPWGTMCDDKASSVGVCGA